jgi:hypothetical protein
LPARYNGCERRLDVMTRRCMMAIHWSGTGGAWTARQAIMIEHAA